MDWERCDSKSEQRNNRLLCLATTSQENRMRGEESVVCCFCRNEVLEILSSLLSAVLNFAFTVNVVIVNIKVEKNTHPALFLYLWEVTCISLFIGNCTLNKPFLMRGFCLIFLRRMLTWSGNLHEPSCGSPTSMRVGPSQRPSTWFPVQSPSTTWSSASNPV